MYLPDPTSTPIWLIYLVIALQWLAVIAAIAFVIWLIFLPFLVAKRRRHRNTTPILIVCICLGWTFLGWVGALVWANTDNCYEEEEVTV